ncbi:MAG: hypothetical protein RR436_01005 [Clostridia bacterium]
MIKLILGLKGSGKTKTLIDMANDAAKENGSTVCLEKGNKLTLDITHEVRLINTDDYEVTTLDEMYAFIGGICASNYDVNTILIDSILKICTDDMTALGAFLDKINKIEDTKFVITVSADISAANDEVKKYL